MKHFFKENLVFFVLLPFLLFIELYTLYLITGSIIITRPWFALCSLGILFSIYLFIKSKKWKKYLLSGYLFAHFIVCIACLAIYENTGSYFDYNMLKLTREALVAANSLIINYWYIVICVLLIIAFTVLADYLFKKIGELSFSRKITNIIAGVVLGISLIGQTSIIIISNKISQDNFNNFLYTGYGNSYSLYGQSSAAINEFYKMFFFNKFNDLSNEEISEFIYEKTSTPTDKFGISKDNNIVTIMVESLEWFPFISDPSLYPNGVNVNEDTLDNLFPNLRKFYNMSAVMNNHHARNKTDMSEIESTLGALPNNKYVAYNYADNNMIYSVANSLKLLDNDIVTSFFHNNNADFYDRENVVPSLGFDNNYFIEDMVNYGVTSYITTDFENLNADSDMVEHMKDQMFLTNKRFYTHITTLSSHGYYVYRDVFSKWYDKMDTLNINISDDRLKNYLAGVMDFDCALGLILEDLEKKNLMDSTTIVLYADHNAYVEGVSNYVKNIYELDEPNSLNLFRLPLMIYDPSLSHQIIDKFTTTFDIAVTLLDMLGINHYSNLYYGNSIFSSEISILYSKVANIFMTDDLYFYNINDIIYNEPTIEDEPINIIEEKCLILLNKIYYTNHIFDYDYFKNKDNLNSYLHSFLTINNNY